MIIIAHRGNINGPSHLENHPMTIELALNEGFDVEVDVWLIDGKLFLGHDTPDYSIELKFIQQEGFWCHAKNIEALEYMLDNNVHCFWHDTDDYTITSKGYIWAYPEKKGGSKVITVMPEIAENNYAIKGHYIGVCTDYPKKY